MTLYLLYCIFYFLPWRLPFRKAIFHKTMPFPLGLQTLRVYSTGGMMTFLPGLFFIGAINRAFSIGTLFEYWKFKFLSIVFLYCIYYIWKQPLKGVPWNMGSTLFQTKWIKIRTHYNDREDQHHHLRDVKFLLITCI